MLQVDRLVWPAWWSQLQSSALAALDQFADSIEAIVTSGNKRIGLASCVQGEGITTILLAAGRHLADRGLRVVLVDANFSNPQVARTVGLLPQIGWEETLGGRLPLAEVVIDALEEHLTLLPLNASWSDSESSPDSTRIAESLGILTDHFDVVLMDLGPLYSDATAKKEPDLAVARCAEAVILVQNVRSTAPNRFADLQTRLGSAGIVCAGVVQNFVAG
jgi:Mrp family chromosome partitioning ATPase